jgi:hypothetical protein
VYARSVSCTRPRHEDVFCYSAWIAARAPGEAGWQGAASRFGTKGSQVQILSPRHKKASDSAALAAESEAFNLSAGIPRRTGAARNETIGAPSALDAPREPPPPTADLFISAGAIIAERAARGAASRSRIEEILRRAVDQATALRGEAA